MSVDAQPGTWASRVRLFVPGPAYRPRHRADPPADAPEQAPADAPADPGDDVGGPAARGAGQPLTVLMSP